MLPQPGEVGHGLGGVIDIALQVDKRRALGQHALTIAVVERFAHLAHIGVAGAEVHIVADADSVRAEGDHVGGFTYGFAVGNLRFTLVQVLLRKAEQV